MSNQFINKQAWYVKLLMLTQAVETGGPGLVGWGGGAKLIEITNFYVNFQEKCFNKGKPVYC